MTCIAQKFYKISEIKVFLLLAKQIAAAVPHKVCPFGQCITPFKGERWKGFDKTYSFRKDFTTEDAIS